MNIKYVNGFFFSLLIFFFFSCSDKNSENTETSDSVTSDVQVVLKGIVTNTKGEPIPFVSMTTQEGVMETDSLGEFIINNPTIEGDRYVIRFSKEGFYDFIYSKEQTDSSGVFIILTPRGNSDISRSISFSSGKGISVNINGMIVQIPSNVIAYDDTGEDYNGVVKMDMLYLNPDSSDFKRMMPGGDMLAIRTSLDTTFLISCGMVNVLLSDENGRKLQLRKSSQASLTYPIPVSMQECAPDTMPLWYFDEKKGLWIEDGYSVKEGNVYKGVVNHFTWWNGDQPELSAQVNLTITTENGIPISNIQVLTLKYAPLDKSKSLLMGSLTETILIMNGHAKGYVPANTHIEFYYEDELIGELKPLKVKEKVDLTLVCKGFISKSIKFEDIKGNPFANMYFVLKKGHSWSYLRTSDEGIIHFTTKKENLNKEKDKYDIYYNEEKLVTLSHDKMFKSINDTQKVVLNYNLINYVIKGEAADFTKVYFYNGKKKFSSFAKKIMLPIGQKFDVVISGYKVGEIPKEINNRDKFIFEFHPLKIINSRSSEKVDYFIRLVGRPGRSKVPVEIGIQDGYDIASSPIIDEMDEYVMVVYCDDVSFSVKNKRKNGYFEPIVIDLAKAGILTDEVDFYRDNTLLLSHRLGQLSFAWIEQDTAYYYFSKPVSSSKNKSISYLKIPNFTKEKKAECQAVFNIPDICSVTKLPVKMKLLKDGKMEYTTKSKVLYLKDSAMADMETKLKLPAVALGQYEKNSQLSVDHRFPELLFPLDFVFQHSYASWDNLYACNKKAPYSFVEKMRKTLEKKGYDERITKRVITDDYEEYWYYLLMDTGEAYQVNIRYSKSGAIEPSKQNVKFVFTIKKSKGHTLGDMETSANVENCPLQKCQLFVAFSKMNMIGADGLFEQVKKEEEEAVMKNSKKRKR